jgi:hypothetical protein
MLFLRCNVLTHRTARWTGKVDPVKMSINNHMEDAASVASAFVPCHDGLCFTVGRDGAGCLAARQLHAGYDV